jgi:hypothetical protein
VLPPSLTRRALLARAAYGAGSVALGSQLLTRTAAAAGPALPTPAQVRADVQRMVDFGPRLTGNDAHNAFIAWLEREFTAAGCDLLPCDVYETSRWEVGRFGLDVLDGDGAGPVKVGTYFPRSKETPAGGVTGPLVYAGSPPQPAINAGDATSLQPALARYPDQLASWAQALPGTLSGSPQGGVLLVDLPAPVPATAGILGGALTYYNGQGESAADLLAADYKRLWLIPGLSMPLAPFAGLGVAGVVFVLDCSFEALRGQYMPFEWQNEDIPALYVDRDTGQKLRAQAAARPQARLTLTATRKTVPTPTVTAVLPGAGAETIIFNTHTDGQGFVEENGPVAFVHLARYFGALAPERRLRRTLVFAAWPGHMSNDLPQGQGWIDAHKDLVDKAAAALTVEHLGCTEWTDDLAHGYHASGREELFAIWTSQGAMFDLTKAAVIRRDLPRTALLRPPAQFGVGGPFYQAGIPEIGAIAGPEYLLTISDDGEMGKFDERLAAKQIAFLADLAVAIDPVGREQLRSGDPTLGSPAPKGNVEPSSAVPKRADCTPAAAAARSTAVEVRWYGRRRSAHDGLVVAVRASDGTLDGVVVELRRGGRLIARSRPATIAVRRREIVLRRAGGRRFPTGAYSLLVKRGGAVLARRAVRAR